MMYKCYIDGKLVDGKGGVVDVVNPGTGEIAGSVSVIDEAQIEETLLVAKKGYEYWSSLTLEERAVWIKKFRDAVIDKGDEIIQILMSETGKLLEGARGDYQMLVDCLEFFIAEAKAMEDELIRDPDGNLNIIRREPLGVVVAYLAWNFPLLNVGYKVGPALASGCSIIIKPSESTPLATLKIGEILAEIGFPPGVVNFVLSKKVSTLSHICNSSDIPQMITLIGSTNTGKRVIADSLTSIKRFSLELGGNAPALVLKDFDIEKAANEITQFKFENTGQVCVSPNRVYVHEAGYEAFVKKAGEIASNLKPGWGTEPGATVGPMITEGSRDQMFKIIEDAVSKGARLVCGGKIPSDKKAGFYFEPTVLADVTKDMLCYQEEIFGPIMPIIKYTDSTDLIAEANDTEYGLTSYIYSNDMSEINRIASGIKAGTVCVNKPVYKVELPHGGVKNSGIGKDCSKYSLDEYYYLKRITIGL